MTPSNDRLATVAERAARAGGEYLAATFRNGPVAGDYGPEDVRATVDREAEQRVLESIAEAFPDHAIHAEESGRTDTDSDYRWFVDPLDGTNNFASGLPTFATVVAVRRAGRTRVAAIHEPIADDLYLARRGQGATVDGATIHTGSDLSLEHGTIALAVGLRAIHEPTLRAAAERLEEALDGHCKRVLSTWAPCVDWGLLARGRIEGFVALYPPPHERHAGELLAAESGVSQEILVDYPATVGGGNGSTSDDRTTVDDGSTADDRDWDGDGLYVGAGDTDTLEDLLAIVRGE